MRVAATFFTALAIGLATTVGAQPPVQTRFTIRQGWLRVKISPYTIVLDSAAAPNRQNIPTDYTILDGYRLALTGAGEIFVYPPGQQLPAKSGYAGKDGGPPVQLLAYSDKHLLFLAVSDGYVKPRRYKLVELNLTANTFQQLAKAKQLDSVRYSADLSQVSYRKDGFPAVWRRKPE
ncbi:hypothetical protein [Hymenobacter elongatus]|uniref:DUF4968 domain-containing protein n=1 Tax=Hymenobacter elongatus TaxID=877208 RepID=A0A4Z0PE46_9BACT|nr:hypothetical protein [Hymenobacter elongatus]TGE12065.1 hypothetical protein E5J99_20590 [Hymenobacter elongatus]